VFDAGNTAAGTDMENQLTELTNLLSANYTGNGFLAAGPNAMTLGLELMLSTGIPVIALGGFNGSDRIISVKELMA